MDAQSTENIAAFQVPDIEKPSEHVATPSARAAALKEPVLIPRNPVVPLIRTVSLIVILDVSFLIFVNFLMIFSSVSSTTIFWLLTLFLLLKVVYFSSYFFFKLMPWANTGYYISKSHLVRKRLKRDITQEESTFELRNIQQVRMNQGILGMTFDYGNVILSMQDPQHHRVFLRDIKDPSHYKSVFENYISLPAP